MCTKPMLTSPTINAAVEVSPQRGALKGNILFWTVNLIFVRLSVASYVGWGGQESPLPNSLLVIGRATKFSKMIAPAMCFPIM